MFSLRSAIETYPSHIDSRMLIMEGNFFGMTRKESDDFLLCVLRFIRGALEEQCLWDGIRSWDSAESAILSEPYVLAGADGVVKGRQFPNKTSFRRWTREQLYPAIPKPRIKLPFDYEEIFNRLLTDVETEKISWKAMLLQLFALPNRIQKLPFEKSEVSFSLVRNPDYSDERLFCGKFDFSVSVYCLGESCDNAAMQMADFLREAEPCNLNASILLSADPHFDMSHSPHYVYFRDCPDNVAWPPRAGQSLFNWISARYVYGPNWFHRVSPLAQGAMTLSKGQCKQYPALNIQYRRDGVLSVQSNAPITECDIADLVPMKQMLYPILYPGSMKFQKDALRDRKLCVYWAKPRMYWEVLPLFENEVSENENEVIFTYQGPNRFRFEECGVKTHTFPQK